MNGGLEKKFFENIASKTSEISTRDRNLEWNGLRMEYTI